MNNTIFGYFSLKLQYSLNTIFLFLVWFWFSFDAEPKPNGSMYARMLHPHSSKYVACINTYVCTYVSRDFVGIQNLPVILISIYIHTLVL